MGDVLDLPVKRENSVVKTKSGTQVHLTETHVDAIVTGGTKAVSDFGEVAKGVIGIAQSLVGIARLKEEARIDVERIDAQTRSAVQSVRAEIDRLVKAGDVVRTKGQVAVQVIMELTAAIKSIPEGDDRSRQSLVDQMRLIVELALKPD